MCSNPRLFRKGVMLDLLEPALPEFFKGKQPMAGLMNFDADLYSSTITALSNARPVIDHKTTLVFDEFIVNNNWEQDEFKAFDGFCEKTVNLI